MSILWQLRHTVVHNVGLITHSDAVKFRLLSQEQVASRRILVPTRNDVRYVKRFLDETAGSINSRVGQRLAALLTTLRTNHGVVFDPQQRADQLTRQFTTTFSRFSFWSMRVTRPMSSSPSVLMWLRTSKPRC